MIKFFQIEVWIEQIESLGEHYKYGVSLGLKKKVISKIKSTKLERKSL